MRIILNSDIIYTKRPLVTGLPAHIDRFCRDAASAGAILVLPRTTLLESERNEQQQVEEAIAAIDSAVTILARWEIKLPELNARELVRRGDLVALLRSTGIAVEVEEPLLEDYQEAERRACLHLPPQPPDTQSDEMRDLVIWAVALRLARRDGKAILVSRDHVHIHERGRAEAETHGLICVKTFDEVLDFIDHESPSGAWGRSVLTRVWTNLRTAGLPLPTEVSIRRTTNLVLHSDAEGRGSGKFDFSLNITDGQLLGTVHVEQIVPDQIRIELRNLRLNDEHWEPQELTIDVQGELPRIVQPASARLQKLRAMLEDSE